MKITLGSLAVASLLLGCCTGEPLREKDPYYHCRLPLRTNFNSHGQKIQRSTCTPDSPKLPHEESCGCYIGCPTGYYQVVRCAEGLLFDRHRRACHRANEVQCGNAAIPPITPKPTAGVIPELGPRCPAPNGLFPHPKDCRLYLNCTHGSAKVLSCLNGNVFSRILRKCVHPSQGDCGPLLSNTSHQKHILRTG